MAVLLPSCAAVGPDYTPPKTKIPGIDGIDTRGLSFAPMNPGDLPQWWMKLKDPMLTDLIHQAVSGNLNLKAAFARLQEARARRGLSRTDQYPTLDASGKASRSYSNKNHSESYAAGLDAGWEIDIFGGVRRAIEASEADLEASAADLRDVMVSLTAEVALNYMDVRTLQAKLQITEEAIKIQQGTDDLVNYRYQAGLTNELALQQAHYNLANTRSQVPDLRTRLDAAENRLAVLTGQPPGKCHDLLAKQQPIPTVPPTVAVGIPAEVLRQRPDIRKAERQLAAQTARIGVATADLYPRFSLSGTMGLESVNSGDLLTAGSRYWNIGPGITWKIFDAGAIRRNIDVQSAITDQDLIAYEKTVLEAVEEVKNAVKTYAEDQIKKEHLAVATDAAKRAESLALNSYQSGMADFGDVLEAQRSLLSFQEKLADIQGSLGSDLIRLYKALGGGWHWEAVKK